MCKALRLNLGITTSTQQYTSSYDAIFLNGNGKHDTCVITATIRFSRFKYMQVFYHLSVLFRHFSTWLHRRTVEEDVPRTYVKPYYQRRLFSTYLTHL